MLDFLLKYLPLLIYFQLWEKSATEEWIDDLINSSVANEINFVAQDINGDKDPFAELEQYLEWPPVPHSHCSDVIAFWGVSLFSYRTIDMGLINLQLEEQYLVVCIMAHDYMAIPGLICLA